MTRPIEISLGACITLCGLAFSSVALPAAATVVPLVKDRTALASRLVAKTVTWRRVASPESRGGSENEALLETVEIDRSDMDIAGLMVRCRDRKLEAIVVLIEPQPPGSKADVTLTAGASRQTYVASPIPTGAGLSVPVDIVQNVQNNWVNQPDLLIEVKIAANTISGVVKLNGLADQVTKLQTDCISGH